MTIEGNFKWDLDIPNMKLDELDALIAACNRVRRDVIKADLKERMEQLIAEADANDCYFDMRTIQGTWATISLDPCCIEDKPNFSLDV